MMQTRLVLVGALMAANMLVCSSAFGMSTRNLPPEKTQGSVKYLTGGIGRDEAKAVEKTESKYPLSLEFVQHVKPKDEFLANVDVTIKNQAGKTVLRTTSDGPFLLAKVPDGKYTVMAKDNGKTKVRHLALAAAKPEHVVIAW